MRKGGGGGGGVLVICMLSISSADRFFGSV